MIALQDGENEETAGIRNEKEKCDDDDDDGEKEEHEEVILLRLWRKNNNTCQKKKTILLINISVCPAAAGHFHWMILHVKSKWTYSGEGYVIE